MQLAAVVGGGWMLIGAPSAAQCVTCVWCVWCVWVTAWHMHAHITHVIPIMSGYFPPLCAVKSSQVLHCMQPQLIGLLK